MRYLIVAAGTLKKGFYADGCALYTGRLSKVAAVEVAEIRERHRDPAPRQAETSSGLLGRSEGWRRIALDETGRQFSSEELANHLSNLENDGISRISILIGGADGHTDSLRASVDELWSLSSMTFPHELARLLLLEQLYRAETIRAGHPYHRA